MRVRRTLGMVFFLGGSWAFAGCEGCGAGEPGAESVSPRSSGIELAPELASRVLATVGERKITLGDYAAALDRMDQFERLRYQTAERRRMLLEEMVNVELLAREAERRGLDKRPATRAHIRQILREELLRQLRAQQPQLDEIPAAEVREYYEQHQPEFFDPARRRVAAVAVSSKAKAAAVLSQLNGVDSETWGRVVRELIPKGNTPARPLEFEGDLGLVSAPGEERGANENVPEPIRKAVFKLNQQGDIYPEPVEHEGRYYLVRLLGKNEPRSRTLAEVDSVIRARLLQRRLRQAEDQLDAELRKEIPVQVNEAGLKALQLPSGVKPEPSP